MITILNYGLGNLNALCNVFRRLNIQVELVEKKEDLNHASKIILPGVGAYDKAMKMLNKSGMRDTIDRLVIERKVKVLGICVGMQIMGESSEEGKESGLGWIEGNVKHFRNETNINQLPIPHLGWNKIFLKDESPLFKNLHSAKFYYLHSYFFQCSNNNHILAKTKYGLDFTSAFHKGNLYGVQFHPEKSHGYGSLLLKNFASI